jgi:hypothetical protein
MSVLPPSDDDLARGEQTVLRVHGVGGWKPDGALQSTDVVQVAGDSLSGFYRRPGVVRAGDPIAVTVRVSTAAPGAEPAKPVLEAYNWGLFSSQKAAQAFWLLLFPMAAVNLAGWMFGAPRKTEGKATTKRLSLPNPWGGRLVRLLGLTLTVELMLGALAVTGGVVGEQCAVPDVCQNAPEVPLDWLPAPLTWVPKHVRLPDDPFAHRMALTFLAATLVLVGFWNLCWVTRRRYEKWPRQLPGNPANEAPAENPAADALAEPAFWRGDERVLRLALLHTAVVCAVFGYLAMRLAAPNGVDWLVSLGAAVIVLVAVVGVWLDRLVGLEVHGLGSAWVGRLGPQGLALAGAVFFAFALRSLWMSSIPAPQQDGGTRLLPGWTDAMTFLLITQGVLLLILLFLVIWLLVYRRSPKPNVAKSGPFFRGCAPLGAACLGVGVAAVLTAGVVTGAEVLMVTNPATNASRNGQPQSPLPEFLTAFSTGAVLFVVVLLVAVLAFLLGALAWQARARWNQSVAEFPPMGAAGPGNWATFFRRLAIVKSLSIGRAVEPAIYGLLLGSFAGVVVGVVGGVVARSNWPANSGLHELLSNRATAAYATTALGLLIAGIFLSLFNELRDVDRRRVIGSMWDVATFWPRAAHPFSPPCYAERAVPELTARLQWLTEDKTHSVVLVGYSQGSAITFAALMQLGSERQRIAYLTCASVVRRLYGRAFPAYFGPDEVSDLAKRLTPPEKPPRWRNVFRSTDYLGSWMLRESSPPAPTTPVVTPEPVITDVWAIDPASFGPGPGDNALPATHAHSDFFPDPAVGAQVGRLLAQLSQVPDAQEGEGLAPESPIEE